VARSTFKAVQHAPAVEVRQPDIERDGVRFQFTRQCQRRGAALGDDGFEPAVARHFQQHFGIVRIILDNQQYPVPLRNMPAIILDEEIRGAGVFDHGFGQHSFGAGDWYFRFQTRRSNDCFAAVDARWNVGLW